jgi:hypothetical protein
MAKSKTISIASGITLWWRPHTSNENGPKRVWRSDWAPDAFEILDEQEWDALSLIAKRFGIVLKRAED